MEPFDTYLFQQQALGRSPYTVEKARWAWRKWRDFTGNELTETTLEDVIAWHKWLFDSGLGRNTVSTHARVLHTFFKWAKARGYVSFSPPSAPAPKKPDRRTLTPAQAQAFIAALESGRNTIRNRTIGALFLATGLRLRELAEAEVADLDLAAGLIRVRAETSKSQRSRIVPLGTYAKEALHKYVLFGRMGSTMPQLFLSEGGGPLGRRGIHLLIRRAARKAAVGWASPHVLRHTFATQALLDGASVFALKAMLGHASIKSTEVYMDMAAIEASLRGQGWSPADTLLRRSQLD